MTRLRPQNVAAASVRTAEVTAVAQTPTPGRRWLPARISALALGVGLCVATSVGAANAETPSTALRPLERSVVTEMNGLRREHGLLPLRLSQDSPLPLATIRWRWRSAATSTTTRRAANDSSTHRAPLRDGLLQLLVRG